MPVVTPRFHPCTMIEFSAQNVCGMCPGFIELLILEPAISKEDLFLLASGSSQQSEKQKYIVIFSVAQKVITQWHDFYEKTIKKLSQPWQFSGTSLFGIKEFKDDFLLVFYQCYKKFNQSKSFSGLLEREFFQLIVNFHELGANIKRLFIWMREDFRKEGRVSQFAEQVLDSQQRIL